VKIYSGLPLEVGLSFFAAFVGFTPGSTFCGDGAKCPKYFLGGLYPFRIRFLGSSPPRERGSRVH